MNALVSMLKYLVFIVLGVLAVGIVCCAVLIVGSSSGVSIAGYHYLYSRDANTKTVAISGDDSSDFTSANIIRFETDTTNISLQTIPSDKTYKSSDLTLIYTHSMAGFVKYDGLDEDMVKDNQIVYANLLTTELLTEDGQKVLHINLTEPNGLIFKTSVGLTIYCTKDALAGKKVEFVTDSGSIYVGDSYTDKSDIMKVSSLTINNASGNVYLRSTESSGDIKITKDSGNIVSSKDIVSNMYVEIKDKYGKIEIPNMGTNEKDANLTCINMENSSIEIEKLHGDLILEANGGLVDIDTIYGTLVANAKSCDYDINKITGDAFITSNDGKIEIDAIDKDAIIQQGKGVVKIKTLTGKANIETSSGDITIENANNNCIIKTDSGDIKITCTTNFDIEIEAKNGNTTIDKMRGALKFNVVDNGSASVNVKYEEINRVSDIKTESGNVSIKVAVATGYYLSWSTNKSANIHLLSYNSSDKKGSKGMDNDDKAQADYADQLLITSATGKIDVTRVTE